MTWQLFASAFNFDNLDALGISKVMIAVVCVLLLLVMALNKNDG